MHTHQFFTWTTHTAENTTLLDYKKLYTYMCNIVTEFYLYSIVYIYLINSRLDVTHSVRHHFRTLQTLSSIMCYKWEYPKHSNKSGRSTPVKFVDVLQFQPNYQSVMRTNSILNLFVYLLAWITNAWLLVVLIETRSQ